LRSTADPTAQPEEHLDQPTLPVDSSDELGGKVEPVRRDPERDDLVADDTCLAVSSAQIIDTHDFASRGIRYTRDVLPGAGSW
jgi:hypothetical protein